MDQDRSVESRRFIEIVEGRLEEIIENVWHQIPNEFYDKLLGGLIITGGGSNMKNIEKAFINHTHIDKVRIAKFVNPAINSANDLVKSQTGMMNTVLGLLIKGDINCAGQPIDPNGDLFGSSSKHATPNPADTRKPRQGFETPTGVVRPEAERQKAEEEARLKREEEERLKREEEERRLAEEERIRRENSTWNKLKKGILKFGKTIVEEE